MTLTLHAGSERLDAALLLAPRFGVVRKERMTLTLGAIRRELVRSPSVCRYSGIEGAEGTFTACGFWLAEASALLRDRSAAVEQIRP